MHRPTNADRFLHWPTRRHLAYACGWATVVAIAFGVLFGGANWITTTHAHRVRLHLHAELSTPFLPWMVVVYLSLNVMLALAPFVLRTREELRAFALTLIGMMLLATPAFLLLPADPIHPPPTNLGSWQALVDFARVIALPHNFAPSLHVAMAVLCAVAYGRQAATAVRIGLFAWSALLLASTLLLHQHYLVDVISGAALGAIGVRWGYRRLCGRDFALDEMLERRVPIGGAGEHGRLDVA
jgi:membrane-associated phospholipid phosphatase